MSDHHAQCPLSPDFEFSDTEAARIDPYEVKTLAEMAYQVTASLPSRALLMKALRPFAWMLDCRCDEIGQAYKEKAAEERADR